MTKKVYTYDLLTDSMFISFPIDYEYKGVILLEEDVLLEYDTNHKPRALEILNASEKFNTRKEQLQLPQKIRMQFEVTDKKINVNVELTLAKNKTIPLTESINNTQNIFLSNEELITPLI